ncbi:MAG: hypothetical protein IPH46_04040 [Bacteroidetes bacterium]|nr:hypothetical protein [Bacteroidota bacterium]
MRTAAKIIKRLIRGREISKYHYKFNENYVIFSHNGFKKLQGNKVEIVERIDVVKDYPAIYQHLLKYKDEDSELAIVNTDGTLQTLINRADQGFHWTNLRDCAYASNFEEEKIVWLAITDKPAFAFDNQQTYISNPSFL